MENYIKTELGEWKTSFVQSFVSADVFIKADVMASMPEKERAIYLTKVWNIANPIKTKVAIKKEISEP